MAYGIGMVVLVLIAQVAAPPEKDAADLKSLDAAQRLLQNGRYAEAEEGGGKRGQGREKGTSLILTVWVTLTKLSGCHEPLGRSKQG